MRQAISKLAGLLILLPLAVGHAQDWISVGGDRGCQRYSTLTQINRENVDQLKVAWTFHTGEVKDGRGKTIECTPIIIDGTMFITTAERIVLALDAATGMVRWRFDPLSAGPHAGPLSSGGVNRGAAYWSDGQAGGARRILHGTSDGRLFSIDAATGKLDPKFGTAGVKDLREDLERKIGTMPYGPTSAPAIYDDLVILGFSVGEGPGIAAPGDVRAFDVRTGQQRWSFRTVPQAGEFGHDTWAAGSTDNRGGANAWGGISVDVERGLVLFGTGSAAFDFFGGDRAGNNLFANCVVAVDARTGKRRWHFQTLHHDLWDHDIPVYPNVVSIVRDGRTIPAAAQVTKTGYVFVLNLETGEPLFEVKEQAVRTDAVEGEQPSPTQPIPVKPPPVAAQHFDETNITNIAPANRQFVLDKLRTLRSGPAFLPPSLEGSVVIPGFHGGSNWSGAAFDPETKILYLNSTNLPNIVQLRPAAAGAAYRYEHAGYIQFRDQEGYPAIAPPWGLLNAIDLSTGEFVWRTVLGEYEELTKRGVPQTGTDSFGGAIVTAGGLVFIAGTRDERIRAFDKSTGKVLWEHKLPAGGYATPSTYSVGGKQYVVIAAGGAGKLGTKAGDAFVAFALSPN
ncbi:MAG: pyrroloquinoline quinone-dependent dehydrogenase [Pirellulaceae bacterium]|nr:pyrroloquinoline quinone-dependent dehydrogenase [Pirellulaceae bacterium]